MAAASLSFIGAVDSDQLPWWDRPIFMRLAAFLGFGLLWQAGANRSNALMIPGFFETMAAASRMLITGEFWNAMLISNQSLVIGFSLAIVTGIPIGAAMGRFRILEKLTEPIVSILLVTPMAAIIPLIMMAIGIGLTSRVLLVYVFSVVMILVQTKTGVRQTDAALIEMSRAFGASEFKIWREILLPASVPSIMTGIRIGLGRAITGMVIAELLLVSVGLGGLVLRYRGFFRAADMYALIILIVAQALLLVQGARKLEQQIESRR